MNIKKIIGWILIPYIKIPKIMYEKWEPKYSKPIRVIGSISMSFVLFLVWTTILGFTLGSNKITQDNTKNIAIIVSSSPVHVSKVDTTPQPTNTPMPTATIDTKIKYDKWVKAQFSPWDGSHYYLVDLLKKNMNDADSFEHMETKYTDNGDGLKIIMKYRGKNAFGGKIINYVTAESDYKSNQINIIKNK
jgi:hypothetical protein